MNLRPQTGRVTPVQGKYGSRTIRRQLGAGNALDAPLKSLRVPQAASASGSGTALHQFRSETAPVFAVRFPAEVWTMIVSYCPHTLPSSNTGHALCWASLSIAEDHAIEGRERYDILRTLSQTCKDLRSLMLPLLWQEVETCVRNPDSDHAHMCLKRFMAHVLREYSVAISRTPSIAIHIKTFTVCMPRCSGIRFLHTFAKCLAALPNLRCLRILQCSVTVNELQVMSSQQQYPQVLALVLPANAYPLLQAFPQLTELVIHRLDFSDIRSSDSAATTIKEVQAAVRTHCQFVKLLAFDLLAPSHCARHAQYVYGIFSQDYMQKLAVALPDLDTMIVSLFSVRFHTAVRDIVAVSRTNTDHYIAAHYFHDYLVRKQMQQLRYLSELPNLAHVKVNIASYHEWDASKHSEVFEEQVKSCFDTVKKVLESKSHGRPKSLAVRAWPSSQYDTTNFIDFKSYQFEDDPA